MIFYTEYVDANYAIDFVCEVSLVNVDSVIIISQNLIKLKKIQYINDLCYFTTWEVLFI
jgi:hypothetical protein